ncbi:MAG: hypothetical protein ACRDHG_04680 [Anaerolineales bacterium]
MSTRIQVRQSPVDGKFRRWEYRSASALGFVIEEGDRDYEVPVCTGVFKTRGAAFRK